MDCFRGFGMKQLIKFIFGVFYVNLFLIAGCASASGTDKSVASKTSVQKIIAIGDIHGDFGAYQTVMRDAGLIDLDGRWIGGRTILVQTGDVPDRGPDTLKIIEDLRALEKQARKTGGDVITLVGNHEAMNMTGDLRYVHAGEYSAFVTPKSASLRDRLYKANKEAIETFYREKNPTLSAGMIKAKWEETTPLGKLEHQKAWGANGAIGRWVKKNPVAVLVDGNLFAHGGFSQKYTVYSIADMNKAAKKALKKQDTSPDSIINDPLGPLWYRGLVPGSKQNDGALAPDAEVDLVLATYGAQRIIVGHTPAKTGVKSSYGGKLIQIDTGMSEHYGGTRSFLRIENGSVFAHDNGVVRKLN